MSRVKCQESRVKSQESKVKRVKRVKETKSGEADASRTRVLFESKRQRDEEKDDEF